MRAGAARCVLPIGRAEAWARDYPNTAHHQQYRRRDEMDPAFEDGSDGLGWSTPSCRAGGDRRACVGAERRRNVRRACWICVLRRFSLEASCT